MRYMVILLVGFSLLVSGCNEEKKQTVTKLETLNQKVSYSVGYDIAKNFKENDFELDRNLIMNGYADGLKGTDPRLDQQQMVETMREFQKYMIEYQQKKIAAEKEKNSTAGKEFLAANKSKDGVVTLESGLQYKIISAGSGATPAVSDVVQVNYRGTLIDGTEFDSSYTRGEPVEFPVGRVIAGWTEALQLMPVGSKWQLFIPSELAYGGQGIGNVIEPNSVLLFEVELLKIVSDQPEVAAPAAEPAAEAAAAVVPAETDAPVVEAATTEAAPQHK